VPHRGLDSHFQRDSGDQVRPHAAVAQHDVEWCALERRHGDLVHDRLAGVWVEPGDELEASRAMRNQRTGVGRSFLVLPDLGLPELIHPGELARHEVMADEDRANPSVARSRKHL
jgi:hypothetical protein